jgi:hypothetical protein
MTYMQDLEQQLHDRLESFAAGDLSAKDFIAFVKTTVLDSYHNGQNAGPRQVAQGTGQNAQSGRPQWSNKKRSAANAPSRGHYCFVQLRESPARRIKRHYDSFLKVRQNTRNDIKVY